MLPLLAMLGANLPLFAGAIPPHIVFVMADDLGSNDVGRWQGVVGDPSSLTPELNELANSGVVLTDCCERGISCWPLLFNLMPSRLTHLSAAVQTHGAGVLLRVGRFCLAGTPLTRVSKVPAVAVAGRAAGYTFSQRGGRFSPLLSRPWAITRV